MIIVLSGTLNPALQDRQGRPKRDISTIIHILNDLLCATPQYRRHSSGSGGQSSRNGVGVISMSMDTNNDKLDQSSECNGANSIDESNGKFKYIFYYFMILFSKFEA